MVGRRQPCVVLCTWAVAKPNYYIPCLPGMALADRRDLAAIWHGWAAARASAALAARGILQAQWVLMFVAAAVAPLVVRAWLPAVALALVSRDRVGIGRLGRAQRSRLEAGADALPLAPIAAACVFGVLIAYGMIAPAENEQRSHRSLAQTSSIDRSRPGPHAQLLQRDR